MATSTHMRRCALISAIVLASVCLASGEKTSRRHNSADLEQRNTRDANAFMKAGLGEAPGSAAQEESMLFPFLLAFAPSFLLTGGAMLSLLHPGVQRSFLARIGAAEPTPATQSPAFRQCERSDSADSSDMYHAISFHLGQFDHHQ